MIFLNYDINLFPPGLRGSYYIKMFHLKLFKCVQRHLLVFTVRNTFQNQNLLKGNQIKWYFLPFGACTVAASTAKAAQSTEIAIVSFILAQPIRFTT